MNKNQTSFPHRKFIQSKEQNVNGTGIFALKTKISGELEKRVIHNIPYKIIKKYGNDYSVAFKFIPYGASVNIDGKEIRIRSFQDLPEEAKWTCKGKCNNASHCPSPICLCIENECF